VSLPCPNHEGNYDCTTFCTTCEGAQELAPIVPLEDTLEAIRLANTWETHYYAQQNHEPMFCGFCEREKETA
jgi:hypothetical protein